MPRPEVHTYGSSVFTIRDALTPAECQRLIALTEGIGYQEAPVTTGMGFVMMPEVRNNTRVMIDSPQRAAWLWERIAHLVPAERDGWRALGLNERFRYYRYTPGQRFRWHRDGCFRRSEVEESLLTCMVYLNDDFEGGETEFQTVEGSFAVRPEQGSVLIFDHPLVHQGAEVRAGRKYAMRTDVMFARISAESGPGGSLSGCRQSA